MGDGSDMIDLQTEFASDIPRELAYRAHTGSSFVPDQRAEQVRAEYAATLARIYADLEKYATTDGLRVTLGVEFARFRDGYRKCYLAYLSSRSRIMSTMIAGPSNFPVRRMEKRNRVADKRREELTGYLERAQTAMNKAMRPELRPVMSGDADAIERLAAKITAAEKFQAAMKDSNLAIRKNAKAGPDAQVAALIAIGRSEGNARELLKPDFCGRIGFPNYELTNNNANIRRMKERLAVISANRQQEDSAIDGENARLEDCPADNRVRLFFPGKPGESVRSDLKRSGFRWSPTIGAWQAYRHPHTIAKAHEVAGILHR